MTENNVLDNKSRELIAVAASIAGNCMPCLRYHFKEALNHGCKPEEIEEAIMVARQARASTIFATALEGFEDLLEANPPEPKS